MTTVDMVGWLATIVFVGSYFSSNAAGLRRLQMAGAAIWMAYGLMLHSAPVVAANLLVLGAAGLSARRSSGSVPADGTGST